MRSWNMREARARLAEVIRKAEEEGPQVVTVRGREAAVVLSREDFERLRRPAEPFVDFMRRSPLVGVELDLWRDRSRNRDVEV